MKKIVPFRKEINFKTNIAEITSISLEHTLKVDDYLVDGDFIVSGEYKMADISTNTEKFSFDLPFNISIDEKYLLDKVTVDIDDFYYEIINDKTLVVNIDVLLNNLEEKPLMEVVNVKEENLREDISTEVKCEETHEEKIIETVEFKEKKVDEIYEDLKEEHPIKMIEDKIMPVTKERKEFSEVDIFNSFEDTENFSTYRVYIVREGDMIDSIIEKYNTNKELLEKYNDLKEIKIGDKLIIPSE